MRVCKHGCDVKMFCFSRAQGGWQRGLEPSLHDRPSQEIWPSETEYHFPSKQIWRRMQTWRDDEFLLGFEFSRVQTSRKGFREHF